MANKDQPISEARERKRNGTSTALWAHLLRKDIVPLHTDSTVPPQPAAPLDKNSTSIRILLHDTQANFEKFSAQVDNLTTKIGDTATEILLVKELFHEEHDKLGREHSSLINRCQEEVQRSLGNPAQVSDLQDTQKELSATTQRLGDVDRRLHTLHLFTQSLFSTLQMNSQALQSLQEQQGQILTAIVPLTALIQAIPLHIENARSRLNEAFQELSKTSMPIPPNCSVAARENGKRSSMTAESDEPSSPHQKKPRLEPSSEAGKENANPRTEDLDATSRTCRKRSRPLWSARDQTNRATPQYRSSPHFFASPVSTASLSGNAQNDLLESRLRSQSRSFQTPRRPLGDIPWPPEFGSTKSQLPSDLCDNASNPSSGLRGVQMTSVPQSANKMNSKPCSRILFRDSAPTNAVGNSNAMSATEVFHRHTDRGSPETSIPRDGSDLRSSSYNLGSGRLRHPNSTILARDTPHNSKKSRRMLTIPSIPVLQTNPKRISEDILKQPAAFQGQNLAVLGKRTIPLLDDDDDEDDE